MSSPASIHWDDFDDDRPGLSIRPLTEDQLAAVLADQDDATIWRPATRPPAAPVQPATGALPPSRPGGSAMAEYRRRRRAHRRTRAVPAAAVSGVTVAVVAVLIQLLPLVAAAVLVAGVGLLHRLLRTPADIRAWRRGAIGEQRTATLLRPLEHHGYVLLHDLAIPGAKANLDHLLVGPTGVWLLDSKSWRGHVGVDQTGLLWHGRRPAADTLRTLWWEVTQVDLALAAAGCTLGARPVLAVTDVWLTAPVVDADGVTVTHPALLTDIIGTVPDVLAPQDVPVVAAVLREWFPPAA